VCYGRQINVGVNDLATTHPEIAAEAYGWDPATVTAGSKKKREWKCPIGHVWMASIHTRTYGHGCAVCAGRQINVGVNDLATTHPEIATQAHGWDPTTVTFGSGKKMQWMCSLRHTWTASVNSRSHGHGCAVCDGRQINIGVNDLATTHPKIAAQAHGWDPTTVTAGSNKKREWTCPTGHVWVATVADVTSGSGCAVCYGRQINVGMNDLATTHPEIAAEAYGWDPTTVTAFSNKRRDWQCARGHIWTTAVGNRTSPIGTGCPGCYAMTFDEMTQRPLKFRAKQRKYT
jgi:hypothetical protein